MRTEEYKTTHVWIIMRHEESLDLAEEGVVRSHPVHAYLYEEHAMRAMANGNERAEIVNRSGDYPFRAYYTVDKVGLTDYGRLVTVPHG